MSSSAGWVIACLLLSPAAYGVEQKQTVVGDLPSTTIRTSLATITGGEYAAQIARMQALVERCKAQASTCTAADLPGNAMVENRFATQWDWLAEVLNKSKDAKLGDREKLLKSAGNRLSDEARDMAGASEPAASSEARTRATAILAQPEFNRVQEQSYLAAKIAALMLLLDQLFEDTGNLLPKAWWLAPTLEYGSLLLAAIGVVLWLWRLNRQERLRIDAGAKPAQAWHAESESWAERAQAEAERSNWREAVHCLYWSAIVMLEGQRLWRQNRARTPREYVNLLDPGSERQRQLRGLTGVFERIWYGLRPAAESDYRDAKAMLEQMRAA